MSILPPPSTPLNQHSLEALETWLNDLGAQKSDSDPCLWVLELSTWSAVIKMEHDELKVTCEQDEKFSNRYFSYGLPRKDVHLAIAEGP